MAASCDSGATTWASTHLGSVADGSGGQQAVTSSNNWGGDDVCLYVPGTANSNAASFTVQNQPDGAFNGNVLAFPDSNIGCEGGNCTWNSGLPAPVSSNPAPTVYWAYNPDKAQPGSMWNALIDSEFSASCSGSNPTPNANVAIYADASPSYSKLGLASSNPVLIDGQLWYTLHVRDGSNGNYNYKTEFSAVTPMRYGAIGLHVGAFYTWIANNDANWDYGSSYMPPTDCLQDIGTGFELWQGGYNLASNGTWILGLNNSSPSTSASPSASPSPSPSS